MAIQERSLSAIMFADVVGYTTLTGRDMAKAADTLVRLYELITEFLQQ